MVPGRLIAAFALLLSTPLAAAPTTEASLSASPGKALFGERCAACHDGGAERAPQTVVLQQMSPNAILKALNEGPMREQASGLEQHERIAIAEYLTDQKVGAEQAQPLPACTGTAALFDRNEPPVLPGWGFAPGNGHRLSRQQAGIDRGNLGRLRLKWALAIPGATRMRAQPSLAGGALYLGTQSGAVHALDRATGCARWTFMADAEVRTATLITPWSKGDAQARPLAAFADLRGQVYAVEAETGKLVWKVRADDHPAARITGTPALHDGVLFVPVASLEESAATNPNYPCCSFRGSIVALDMATGREVWRSWLVEEASLQGTDAEGRPRYGPSGVPVWNAPAIDAARGLLYVGTGNNYSNPATGNSSAILALELTTGRIRWRYQATAGDVWNVACVFRTSKACPEDEGPDFDFGAGTVLARDATGREVLLAGQKSGIAYALDPGTGALLWQTRVGRGAAGGGIQFGIAAEAGRMFAAVTDWGGQPTGFPASPGLHALDIVTGRVLWKALHQPDCADRPMCRAGYGGTVVATPDLVFAGADDGLVRIHDAATGKLLWSHDTTLEVTGIGGATGRGGAIAGGTGPVVWQGSLYVPSGYGYAGKMPGNLLLAFTTD